ncbi:MAG: thiamine phosphate synthase [Dehalococcoidales bacterium]|nr:thiamine phosphate synthase [Dehalococcoidales bacterium]
MIEIYADGAYNPVLGQGGWGVVAVENGQKRIFSGLVKQTTSNRMEITAALEGISRTPQYSEVVVHTDSQYLFGSMTKGWQRRANRDLWAELDKAQSGRKVRWEWLDQTAGNPFHKEAHTLATGLASQAEMGLGKASGKKAVPPPSAKPPFQTEGLAKSIAGQAVTKQLLRIIDANLNRAAEGLRLLEEIARLLLNDVTLTQQLKTLRHELIVTDVPFQQQLLQSRNAEGDVGIDLEAPGEEKGKELAAVLVANSRRVQESLRTLEELAKIPGITPELDSEKFVRTRFNLYTIEQDLMSKLLRQDKLVRLSGLYVIIDAEALKGRPPLEAARQVIQGGAKTIQLRDKVRSKEKILAAAAELKRLCAEHEVLFIINDYLDIALASDADGLHLGQDDLPIEAARKLLPPGKIVGGSATSVEQAVKAQSAGADYVAVGSIYPTSSKTSTTTPAKVVGLETLRQVREAVTLPLVAIGGITKDNTPEVIAAGADSVAVISAVLSAESPEKASREIADCFNHQNE